MNHYDKENFNRRLFCRNLFITSAGIMAPISAKIFMPYYDRVKVQSLIRIGNSNSFTRTGEVFWTNDNFDLETYVTITDGIITIPREHDVVNHYYDLLETSSWQNQLSA